MSLSSLIDLAVCSLLWMVTTRAAVRIAGKGLDNGWDNAFAHWLALALGMGLGYVALSFMVRSNGGGGGLFGFDLLPFLAIAAALPVLWIGLIFALRHIYEVGWLRAGAISGMQLFAFGICIEVWGYLGALLRTGSLKQPPGEVFAQTLAGLLSAVGH